MEENNLCIIPARGGSKRIPRKNIKKFLGKPIIAYSIQAALESKLFGDIIVSTDDDEIAQIAIQYGASVPFMRSNENANDFASTIDVINEVLDDLSKINKNFTNICCLYATAPLVKSYHLVKGLEILHQKAAYSVFPITSYNYPPMRALELNDIGKVKMHWPENQQKRTQELEEFYHDAGQWYWLGKNFKYNNLFSENSYPLILDNTEVQDIDTIQDWEIAEMKFRLIYKIDQ